MNVLLYHRNVLGGDAQVVLELRVRQPIGQPAEAVGVRHVELVCAVAQTVAQAVAFGRRRRSLRLRTCFQLHFQLHLRLQVQAVGVGVDVDRKRRRAAPVARQQPLGGPLLLLLLSGGRGGAYECRQMRLCGALHKKRAFKYNRTEGETLIERHLRRSRTVYWLAVERGGGGGGGGARAQGSLRALGTGQGTEGRERSATRAEQQNLEMASAPRVSTGQDTRTRVAAFTYCTAY